MNKQVMYKDYFGLAEPPFRIVPDPRFLWYSEQHLEAKSKIVYYLTEGAGPIYLLAEVGTGKSTIARRIVQELKDDKGKKIVIVNSPELKTLNSFLRFVMDEFNVKTERSYHESLKNFENYLLDQHEKNISPILLIDEAQNMNGPMLKLIQHLFNFSTDTEFLIHIAMFGQPELQKKLNRLKSLKSRLAYTKLPALNREQTEEMMKFRWIASGGNEAHFPFTKPSIDEIYKLTGGIPRSIVQIANEALLKTAMEDKKKVTLDFVTAGWNELASSQK